ncbi:MAG: ATP-binding protein [Candidatus Woesearchaeota archaeon]
MDKNKLRQVIVDQQELFKKTEDLIDRDIVLEPYLKGNEIVIISGIRRCGKSSLLKLISKKVSGFNLYLNFDDIRLIDFNKNNFEDVQSIAIELLGSRKINYFLDEIQNIGHWERWINNLHAQDIKVFITGSNSNLLSSEISTYLTGRNKVLKLFPFSFKEFLRIKNVEFSKQMTSTQKSLIFKLFKSYLGAGGFPLVVKNDDLQLSKQYFEDILNKDILNRYQIRQVKEIKDLLLYLFSNIGKPCSYSTLKQVTGIKSLSTIKNFIDYFRNVYLLYTLEKFDYSIARQKVSSSKPYAGDNSFLKTVSFNFSENLGQALENAVFLHLLRCDKEIFYHFDKKECDFVVKQGLRITEAIQVCADISNPLTKKREIEGLLHAMSKYKLKKGLILTMEQEEVIKNKGVVIKPVWEWLLEDE